MGGIACVKVIKQLWKPFAQDWADTTGETLNKDAWCLELSGKGNTWGRAVVEGPDENIDKLHWVVLGALACAEKSVHVMAPYFLPDQMLVAALNVAAMRGVSVNVVIPKHGNVRMVDWATPSLLPQLLLSGARIYRSIGTFDHTKLLVVDGVWSLIGSANWDARSTRLNCELDIECYDASLAENLLERVQQA